MAMPVMFENVPEWAEDEAVFNADNTEGWIIDSPSIKFIQGGEIVDVFTPYNSFTVRADRYSFILVTEYTTVIFTLIEDEIDIVSYSDE